MERNYAIDYIKFFSIIFIVCIHTSPFKGVSLVGINGDSINIIITTVARFGVPFFFVASGYLFIQKLKTSKNPKIYFEKYTRKLVLLYLSWLIFYWIFDSLLLTIESISTGQNLTIAFINYFKQNLSLICTLYYGIGSKSSYQLWFLTALIWSIIILYMSFKHKKVKLLLMIGLLFNIAGLFGQIYSGLFFLPILTRDTVFFGMFYTTLGGYFAIHHDLVVEKIKRINSIYLKLLFFSLLVIQIFERYIGDIAWGGTKAGLDYYLLTIPITISLFLIVLKEKKLGIHSVLTNIGKNAVGIYVSHTFFIELFNFIVIKIWGYENIKNYVLFHILFTPMIITVSYVYYYFLQVIKEKVKINFRRHISPTIHERVG